MRTLITGTGSYIPDEIRSNDDFAGLAFYDRHRRRIAGDTVEIIDKFEQITGIAHRRYASDNMNASDLTALAATAAITDAGINRERIDQLIVAHNFGDVSSNSFQSDAVPSLASRVKSKLSLHNPACGSLGESYYPPGGDTRYLKMQGRKVYEFALRTIPAAMKACLDSCEIGIDELKKIFLHLLDMVRKASLPGHRLHPGDTVMFASVGAGMNVNAVCYRSPLPR